ncbi:MAG: hypothetical protein WB421_13865 [Terriglobales bacterium]
MFFLGIDIIRNMLRVFSIDPGLRNMAHCVMDNGAVFDIGNTDIFGGDVIDASLVFEKISKWCDDHQKFFDSADIVVCEKQFCDTKFHLSTCLIVVQTVVQCRARTKFLAVHAMSVKRAYGTICRDHRRNKQKSIERVSSMNPALFQGVVGKIDDMSDAYLLAHFYTYHLHQHKKFLEHETDTNVNVEQHADKRICVQ